MTVDSDFRQWTVTCGQYRPRSRMPHKGPGVSLRPPLRVHMVAKYAAMRRRRHSLLLRVWRSTCASNINSLARFTTSSTIPEFVLTAPLTSSPESVSLPTSLIPGPPGVVVVMPSLPNISCLNSAPNLLLNLIRGIVNLKKQALRGGGHTHALAAGSARSAAGRRVGCVRA